MTLAGALLGDVLGDVRAYGLDAARCGRVLGPGLAVASPGRADGDRRRRSNSHRGTVAVCCPPESRCSLSPSLPSVLAPIATGLPLRLRRERKRHCEWGVVDRHCRLRGGVSLETKRVSHPPAPLGRSGRVADRWACHDWASEFPGRFANFRSKRGARYRRQASRCRCRRWPVMAESAIHRRDYRRGGNCRRSSRFRPHGLVRRQVSLGAVELRVPGAWLTQKR